MKIKNLNPIELHIEKIVLAVAVLGAGYLAYACWSSPTMINENGNTEGPKDIPLTGEKNLAEGKKGGVEARLKELIDEFKARQTLTDTLVNNGKNPAKRDLGLTASVNANDYVKRLADGSTGSLGTLEPSIFAPRQLAAGATSEIDGPKIPVDKKTPSVTFPTIAGGPPMTAEVFQGVVGSLQQPSGIILAPWDANVVKLTAQFPMGKLRDAIRTFPPNFQVVLVTNAQWERSERLANGGWSDYKAVPALAGQPVAATTSAPAVPTTVAASFPLAEVVAKFVDIPRGTKPGEAADYLKQIKLNTEANLVHKLPSGYDRPANQKPMFPEAAPATNKAPDRPVAEDVYGGTIGEVTQTSGAAAGGAAQPAVAPGGIGNFPALTAKEMIDLVTYDDTLKPGLEYKYRVRVSMYNPLYGWPKLLVNRLADPKMAETPFVYSDWIELASPVKVDPTEYFFVTNSGGLGGGGKTNTVRIELFKRKLGVWYKAIQDEVPVGGQIGVGTLSLFDKRPDAEKDFSTKFSIVDVASNAGKVTGVVLTNVLGDLVARSVMDDVTSPKYKELELNYSKGGPAVAPAAGGGAPGPAAGMP